MAKNSNPFKTNLIITSISLIVTALSFSNQIVIAFYFGTSVERDAYFAAISIPIVLTSIFLGSIAVNFLPKYSELKESKGKSTSDIFFLSVLNWTLIGTSIICIVIYLNAESIVLFFFEDLAKNNSGLLKILLLILLPSFVLQGAVQITSYFLNYSGFFLLPTIVKIFPIALSILCVILMQDEIGIVSLALGFTIGNLFSLISLIVFIFLKRLIKFSVQIKTNSLDMVKLSLPLIIASTFARSFPLIERTIASSQGEGSISYLGYANQLATVLVLLTSSGLSTILFPLLAKMWVTNKKDKLKVIFVDSICYLLLICIPIAVYILFFGENWIAILFERGAFTNNSSYNVWLCLSALMGFFISSSLGEIIGKSFYYGKKTKISATIDLIVSLIYFTSAFIFGNLYGAIGLALSLSGTTILHNIISLFLVNKLLIKYNYKYILKKLLLYSFTSALIGYSLIKLIVFGQLLTSFISALVFFILIILILGFLIKDIYARRLITKFSHLINLNIYNNGIYKNGNNS